MANPQLRLTSEQIEDLARALPLWQVSEDASAIARTLKFKDFRHAFAFMTEVAAAAEAGNHHPDWSNSYNRVAIRLTTHEAGGLSERDARLAAVIDAAAVRFGAASASDA